MEGAANEWERGGERRLDAVLAGLRELSADLDSLLLLGAEIGSLGRNIDRLNKRIDSCAEP